MTTIPTPGSRAAAKRRKASLERAQKLLDEAFSVRPHLTRGYKIALRKRLGAAQRPVAAAKTIVRELPLGAEVKSEPQRLDLSAGAEAVARCNRGIAERWPRLTAGAVEVEQETLQLARRLGEGRITQAQYDAKCAELRNPAWFDRVLFEPEDLYDGAETVPEKMNRYQAWARDNKIAPKAGPSTLPDHMR